MVDQITANRIEFLKEQLEELGQLNPHDPEEAGFIYNAKQEIRKELTSYEQ